jgi:hypothetical protein
VQNPRRNAVSGDEFKQRWFLDTGEEYARVLEGDGR